MHIICYLRTTPVHEKKIKIELAKSFIIYNSMIYGAFPQNNFNSKSVCACKLLVWIISCAIIYRLYRDNRIHDIFFENSRETH